MAPIIFGLHLAEFKWSKFGNKNMWNSVYHLRRTKFIVYQCALIFCVVSESLGTDVLSDYIDQQKYLKGKNSEAYEFNNDYVGIASYNIFAGIFVAFIFGAAFFFDLIWPERHEDHGIRVAWKICAVVAAVFYFASAIGMTVITATRSAYVTGIGSSEAAAILAGYKKASETPLLYKANGRAVAAVVFAWLGWVSTTASAVILIISKNHDEKFGPWSTHVRNILQNDPEVAATHEKVAPPPVGPASARLATDYSAVNGDKSYADEYNGSATNAASTTDRNESSPYLEPASFEQSHGVRPASAV